MGSEGDEDNSGTPPFKKLKLVRKATPYPGKKAALLEKGIEGDDEGVGEQGQTGEAGLDGSSAGNAPFSDVIL